MSGLVGGRLLVGGLGPGPPAFPLNPALPFAKFGCPSPNAKEYKCS